MPNSIKNQHSGPDFHFLPIFPKGRIPADRNYLRFLAQFLSQDLLPRQAHIFPSNVHASFRRSLVPYFIKRKLLKRFLYLIPIWLHLFPLIRFHRSFNRRIFIIDLNRDHRRIVNQCKTCIRFT